MPLNKQGMLNGKARALATGMLLAAVVPVHAQADSLARHYANTITQADLRARLEILASDSFMGRETGTEGQRLAAQYILEQFRSYGIPPVPGATGRGMEADGYRQLFPVEVIRTGGLSMAVAGRSYTFLQDYAYFTESLRSDLDVAEVMVLAPVSLGGAKLGGASKVVMLLQDRQTQDDPHAMAAQAMEALTNTGTKVLLMVHEQARAIMEQRGSFITREHMRLATDNGSRPRSGGARVQVILITPELAQAILDHGKVSLKKAAATAGKKRLIIKVQVRFTYASRNGPATGENVLGFISGSDKKDELVVVTAHYDHVGVIDGEVYNGADDDGSGTVAVLGMAKAFAKAKAEGHGPRRSMLFMTVSGEEKGLLGSRWYTDHPVFPLDSTVADLNIDMIGRTDTVYGDSSSYVYVIGSRRISNELGNIIERENDALAKLHLDYTFDAADDPNRFYYRSDHYNFAKHGVPIAFFFNGVHADYHGPYDEVDKIRFDLLRQRTLLVFHTAWALANSETRLAKDGPEGGK